jgi:hydrogenase maturation protease
VVKDVQERKGTVVVGLGNGIMTDEGVGIHVLSRLLSSSDHDGDVEFVQAGSSLMAVVHAIAGRRKAVIVDCAWMDEAPGTMRRFSPEEVVSRKGMRHLSLHEGDLLDALRLSRKMEEYPGEVVVYGVQPETVGLGESLSPTLQARIDEYTCAILADLDDDRPRETRPREPVSRVSVRHPAAGRATGRRG